MPCIRNNRHRTPCASVRCRNANPIPAPGVCRCLYQCLAGCVLHVWDAGRMIAPSHACRCKQEPVPAPGCTAAAAQRIHGVLAWCSSLMVCSEARGSRKGPTLKAGFVAGLACLGSWLLHSLPEDFVGTILFWLGKWAGTILFLGGAGGRCRAATKHQPAILGHGCTCLELVCVESCLHPLCCV